MAPAKKRKRRRRPRPAGPPPGNGPPAGRVPGPAPPAQAKADAPPSRRSRSEQRNEAARAALEPLAEGERPVAVTVGAAVAALLGAANAILFIARVDVAGQEPAPGVLAYSGLMFIAAWGMWRARYWAVLGMQAVLAIVILLFSLFLIRASNLLGVLVALAVIGSGGTLFWFLVKALARIQMPERR